MFGVMMHQDVALLLISPEQEGNKGKTLAVHAIWYKYPSDLIDVTTSES